MKRLLFLGMILAFALAACSPMPLDSSGVDTGNAVYTMGLSTILATIWSTLLQFAQLAGVASVIAAIVNVLKFFGAIKDGTAGTWFAALDLGAMAVLVALKFFAPSITLDFIDAQAAILAQILLFLLGYVMSLKVGSETANTLKQMNIPMFGASVSEKTTLRDRLLATK